MITKYLKHIYLALIIVTLIFLKVFNTNLVEKISLINYDFYQKVIVKGEVEGISIIDIDEKSLAIIGQFPWRRDVYAKILENINKYEPAAVAFDIFFSEEDRQNPKDLLLQLKLSNDQLKNIDVLDSSEIFINSLKSSKVILPVVGTIKDSLAENNSKPKLRIISKGSDSREYLYKFRNKITSLEKINNNADGIGSISTLPGIDGIIRKVPLLLSLNKEKK